MILVNFFGILVFVFSHVLITKMIRRIVMVISEHSGVCILLRCNNKDDKKDDLINKK